MEPRHSSLDLWLLCLFHRSWFLLCLWSSLFGHHPAPGESVILETCCSQWDAIVWETELFKSSLFQHRKQAHIWWAAYPPWCLSDTQAPTPSVLSGLGRRKAAGSRILHDILKPLSIWFTHHLTWNRAVGETRGNGPWTGKKMKKRSVKISRKLQVIFFLGHGRNSSNVIVNYSVISWHPWPEV